MAKTRVLCVFTTILGNKATAQRLMDAVDRIDGLEATYLLLSAEDYRRYPRPRRARISDAWEIRYIARMKMAELGSGSSFDILLVNSWELVTEFRKLARCIPAAVLMDAVPATIDAQLRRHGKNGWRRTLADWISDVPFGRAVGSFRYFLPMGSDCAEALETRYGMSRDRISVTLAPQDLAFWKPAPKSPSDRFRLLFVGNDFARKGGDFLLRLYEECLAKTCTLTIVSNDAALEKKILPAGAVWRRGLNRDEILHTYRDSDLFLFPTQQDYMPQVLAEALSVGLPCIANEVGGIRDLVRDGQTGFLMSCDAPQDVWASQVVRLRDDRGELERLAQCARFFAEENLDARRFSQSIARVIESLTPRTQGAQRA